MRFVFAKRIPGQIEFGIIYGLIALLGLFAGRFLPVLSLAPNCIFKSLTGLPCPTCGSTRSIVHLAHADFSSALALNPMIVVVFFAFVIIMLYSITTLVFGLPRIRITLSDREKDLIRIFSVLLVLLNWVYLFIALS